MKFREMYNAHLTGLEANLLQHPKQFMFLKANLLQHSTQFMFMNNYVWQGVLIAQVLLYHVSLLTRL